MMKKSKLSILLALVLMLGLSATFAVSRPVIAETNPSESQTENSEWVCPIGNETCREQQGERPLRENRREEAPYGEAKEALRQQVQKQDGSCLENPEAAAERRENRSGERAQKGLRQGANRQG